MISSWSFTRFHNRLHAYIRGKVKAQKVSEQGLHLVSPLKNLELIIKNIFFYFDQEIVEFFFIIEWKKKWSWLEFLHNFQIIQKIN